MVERHNIYRNILSKTPEWVRVVAPAFLTVVLYLVMVFVVAIPILKHALIEERKRTAQELVRMVYSLIQEYDNSVKQGHLTLEQAQARCKGDIRKISYGDNMRDYFFLQDTQGHMLAHPYRPDLENTNLLNSPNPNTRDIFVKLNAIVTHEKEGSLIYKWQRYNDPSQLVDKVGYIKVFEPWQWAVATGIYLDSMQAEITTITRNFLWTSLGIAVIVIALSWYAAHESMICRRNRDLAREELHTSAAELEARVARRTAELQAANHELEAFSYSVSHDLRSPLRSINGLIDMLLEDHRHEFTDEAKQLLERIQNTSCRMSRLIDDILQLSRIAQHQLTPQTIDLTQLAQQIIKELLVRYPNHHVDVLLPETLTIEGDPVLLTIILQNLLDNAMKFSAHNDTAKVALGVRTDCRPDVFFVRDNGTGFNMNNESKLFKPFERLHTDEDFAGTGIGLATVHRAVQRHGGRIWAEAAEGRGATFFFTLQPT